MHAIERGELDGIVGYSWGVARVGNRDDLASGRLKILMQRGLTKHKELAAVPLLDEFVTDAADRQVLELTFSREAILPAAGCTARPRSARGRGATCGIRRSYARPGKATEVHMKNSSTGSDPNDRDHKSVADLGIGLLGICPDPSAAR